MLVHIVELSTALLKVDTKVTNASLTHNQCLQCVPLASTHAEILQPRDATELNNDQFSDLQNCRQKLPIVKFSPVN